MSDRDECNPHFNPRIFGFAPNFAWFGVQVQLIDEAGREWFLVRTPQKKYPMYGKWSTFQRRAVLASSTHQVDILRLELLIAAVCSLLIGVYLRATKKMWTVYRTKRPERTGSKRR